MGDRVSHWCRQLIFTQNSKMQATKMKTIESPLNQGALHSKGNVPGSTDDLQSEILRL